MPFEIIARQIKIKHRQPTEESRKNKNMSSIRLIGHKRNTGRMKNISLRYDFVREQVRLGTIRIEHLHTTKTTADTLIKPLGALLFAQHALRLPIRTTLRLTSFAYAPWTSLLNVLH